MGDSGEVRGEVGMPNESFKKPICEHVKNILRGRKAWGLMHALTDTWAQLPSGTMELPVAQRQARAPAKRSRAGAPKAPIAMADLSHS